MPFGALSRIGRDLTSNWVFSKWNPSSCRYVLNVTNCREVDRIKGRSDADRTKTLDHAGRRELLFAPRKTRDSQMLQRADGAIAWSRKQPTHV